jgi:hypothetical protein
VYVRAVAFLFVFGVVVFVLLLLCGCFLFLYLLPCFLYVRSLPSPITPCDLGEWFNKVKAVQKKEASFTYIRFPKIGAQLIAS